MLNVFMISMCKFDAQGREVFCVVLLPVSMPELDFFRTCNAIESVSYVLNRTIFVVTIGAV